MAAAALDTALEAASKVDYRANALLQSRHSLPTVSDSGRLLDLFPHLRRELHYLYHFAPPGLEAAEPSHEAGEVRLGGLTERQWTRSLRDLCFRLHTSVIERLRSAALRAMQTVLASLEFWSLRPPQPFFTYIYYDGQAGWNADAWSKRAASNTRALRDFRDHLASFLGRLQFSQLTFGRVAEQENPGQLPQKFVEEIWDLHSFIFGVEDSEDSLLTRRRDALRRRTRIRNYLHCTGSQYGFQIPQTWSVRLWSLFSLAPSTNLYQAHKEMWTDREAARKNAASAEDDLKEEEEEEGVEEVEQDLPGLPECCHDAFVGIAVSLELLHESLQHLPLLKRSWDDFLRQYTPVKNWQKNFLLYSLGAAALILVGTKVYQNREQLQAQTKEKLINGRDWLRQSLVLPAREIYRSVFDPPTRTNMSRAELETNEKYFRQMYSQFAYQHAAKLSQLEQVPLETFQESLGRRLETLDMSLVNGLLASELSNPVRNLVFGNLADSMLLQIQHLKLTVEDVLLTATQALEANQINFHVMTALPALAAVYLGILSVRAVYARRRHSTRAVQRKTLLRGVQQRLSYIAILLIEHMNQPVEEQDPEPGFGDESLAQTGFLLYHLYSLGNLIHHKVGTSYQRLHENSTEAAADLSLFGDGGAIGPAVPEERDMWNCLMKDIIYLQRPDWTPHQKWLLLQQMNHRILFMMR